MPPAWRPRFEIGETGGRSGVDQRDAGRSLDDGRGNGVPTSEKLQIDVGKPGGQGLHRKGYVRK